MKFHNFFRSSLVIGALALLFVTGCKEEISSPEYPVLLAVSNDTTGGAWKTYLIASPDEVKLPAPSETNSAEYQAELAALKTSMSSRTAEQLKDAKYWASGAVLRWNQIARALVAKYNVAPVAVIDSVGKTSYPVKNVPFANPPIASRIYSYLSVAQYDALVATWNMKYKVNRPSPKQIDNSITTAIDVPNMPSFPSEHSAVAAVSCEVLAFFFPAEKDYLVGLAMKHEDSRIRIGANVMSDITAGDSLGKFISAKAIARAKTDGAGNAAKEDTLRYPHRTDGHTWVPIEIPISGATLRPGMLPSWGKVKTWAVPNVDLERPMPPPAIDSKEFKDALAEVKSIADTRTREQWRIADLWADGASTFTPPGKWNYIAEGLIRKNNMNELRAARTLALMNMSIMDAGICCWDVKYFHYVPRPSQVDPSIKTATGVPNFPSYMSGHATFSGAASTVLGYIFPSEVGSLNAQADEAALSRLLGSIHYRFDNEIGLACGRNIAGHAVALGRADGAP
ncbi:MAG: phosphatase PAP2 family protein [Ignavibacteriae bacterium]|nr:phosphatase PAP2 family protein [Ignavibacteriota bacterium]